MKFDLGNLLRDKEKAVEVNCSFNSELLNDISKDNIRYDYINIMGVVINLSGVLEFKGKIDFGYSSSCARCIEKVEQKDTLEVQENFHNSSSVLKDDEYTYIGRELDLTKFVVDNVLLSIPIRHLCSEDCNGLCSVCGTNLNEKECDCEVKYNDPRLDKLSDLFK